MQVEAKAQLLQVIESLQRHGSLRMRGDLSNTNQTILATPRSEDRPRQTEVQRRRGKITYFGKDDTLELAKHTGKEPEDGIQHGGKHPLGSIGEIVNHILESNGDSKFTQLGQQQGEERQHQSQTEGQMVLWPDVHEGLLEDTPILWWSIWFI